MKQSLMRSIILTIILLIFNGQLFAQNNKIAVVSADNLNVLFTGIDNPVSIAVPGITSDKISVNISRGTITGENGHYVIKVDTVGEVVLEVVAEVSPGIMRKVDHVVFRVRRLAEIRYCIGKHCDQKLTLTLNELLKNTRISFTTDVYLLSDLKMDLVSFTATFLKDDVEKQFPITGNRFSPELLEYIKQLPLPFMIYIEDMRVDTKGGIRQVDPMVIRVI